ncbi:MAG: low temperature requirement protein A [Kordiimonadaceae bacterium]|nr:low temperature requirement protein A [Kordiimonadaceae bacterium]
MVSKFFKIPRLRQHEEDNRHATWLELFFDLVLVAAISQVGHLLVDVDSLHGVFIYVALFWIIFWVWCGHTIYSTRFDVDDPFFRILTFFNMFSLVIMAVEVHNVAHGHGKLFGGAYLVSRILLLILLVRAYKHVSSVRNLIRIYLMGFGTAASIFAFSYLLDEPQNYYLWALAITLDGLTPWVIWKMQQDQKQISAEHVPERFGLFTIIVLGEGVIALVSGFDGISWTGSSFLIAFLSFIITATIWWVYFTHIERAMGKIKLGSGQPYIYSHFPLLVGIVAVGIGILRLLTESNNETVSDMTIYILVGGYALWLLGGILLHFVICPLEAITKMFISCNIVIFIMLCLIGYFSRGENALMVAVLMSTTSLIYAIWDGVARNTN